MLSEYRGTPKAVDALHCRTLMLHSMSREVLVLHSLKARALDDDRVRITAIVRADVPSSQAVDQLVARLLCDELVAGASWRSVGVIANAEEIAEEQALPTVVGRSDRKFCALVKDILVGADTIAVRHSLPIAGSEPTSGGTADDPRAGIKPDNAVYNAGCQ